MELVEQASLQQYLSDVACIAPISNAELRVLAQWIVAARVFSISHLETLVKRRLTERGLSLAGRQAGQVLIRSYAHSLQT